LTQVGKFCLHSAAAFILTNVFLFSAASAADQKFDTRLTAVAFDGATRANVQGDGHVEAVLSNEKLSVSGAFADLPSTATVAHLCLGDGIGVPGNPIFDVTVSGTTEGTFSGTFTLNRKQLLALKSGHVYLQIDSQKAPDGNLWGWLMPDHAASDADVPQSGHGFLPELDVPGNWTQK